jgi:hypothetical protein
MSLTGLPEADIWGWGGGDVTVAFLYTGVTIHFQRFAPFGWLSKLDSP